MLKLITIIGEIKEMINLGDFFGSIIIPADTKESLFEEIDLHKKENEKLNPRFKIYPSKIVPDPEGVIFTKGNHQIFDITFECDIV